MKLTSYKIRAVLVIATTLAATGCRGSEGTAQVQPAQRPVTVEAACDLAAKAGGWLGAITVRLDAVAAGVSRDAINAVCGELFDAGHYPDWRDSSTPEPVIGAWERECPGEQVQVVYDGTATAGHGDMTAAMPTGTTQSSPDLPMQLSSDAQPKGLHFCASPGDFVYISLQNPVGTGSISCSITVDGVRIAANRSSGAYVIASCDGSA